MSTADNSHAERKIAKRTIVRMKLQPAYSLSDRINQAELMREHTVLALEPSCAYAADEPLASGDYPHHRLCDTGAGEVEPA